MPEGATKRNTASNSPGLCDAQLDGASGGVVESIAVKYTMFSPDGTPVRSQSQSTGIQTKPLDNLK